MTFDPFHMSDQDKFDYFYRKIVRKEKVWKQAIPSTGCDMIHKRLWDIYKLAKEKSNEEYVKDLFADLASDFHLKTNIFHEVDQHVSYY